MSYLKSINNYLEQVKMEHPSKIPVPLSTNSALAHILENGILPAQSIVNASSVVTVGYDSSLNKSVFLNCITKIQGVSKAIVHPADGIYSICVERNNDTSFVENLVSEREIDNKLEEQIKKFKKDGLDPEPFLPQLREKVKKDLIVENKEFHDLILKRLRGAAVLVVETPVIESDTLNAPSGCHDALRKSIPPNEIKWIIVSKDLKDSLEIQSLPKEKIIFVDDVIQEVSYTYRCTSGLSTIKIRVQSPNYQTELVRIFQDNFGTTKPMFIHATRLV